MIVAMLELIPDRRAVSAEKKSTPAPTPQIYVSAWRRKQQDTTAATTNGPQPSPAPAWEEALQEDPPARPGPAPGLVVEAPPDPVPSQSTFANRFTPSEAPEPYGPGFSFVPDARVPFSIKKNPFGRPR